MYTHLTDKPQTQTKEPTMTPKQAKTLWGFEVRNSQSRPIAWLKTTLKSYQAEPLINAINQWESDKSEYNRLHVRTLLKPYSPKFEFNIIAPKETIKTEVKEIIKEVIIEKEVIKTVSITQDMDINTVIETVFPVCKGATHIKDLFDAKQPEFIPAKVSKEYYKPENFDTILTALKAKNANVLIKGPAGSGKSLMGKELAKQLELDFFVQSCAEDTTKEDLIGAPKISVDPESGQNFSEFKLAEFMVKLQTPCLCMIDEIFATESGILMGLNGLLEPKQRYIETLAGIVKVHEKARILATSNVDGRNNDRNYVGAGKADGSTLDRFAMFTHGYSTKVERNIVNRLPKLHRDDIIAWLKKLRHELQSANISFDPSTRRLNTCVELVIVGLDPAIAFQACFLEQLSLMELKKIGMDKLETTREAVIQHDDKWQVLAQQGKRLEAIKEYRGLTGCDLKQAKDHIENYIIKGL